MTLLMLSIFFLNRKKIFEEYKGKPEPVSVVIPCYNEEKEIGAAIESILNLNYPKEMIEIIVVDDKSTDNSVNIIKAYVKKHSNVKLIVNKRNSGKAAEPTNIGIKAARYNYIALTDADSSPDKDALIQMMGLLQEDKKTAAVTCAVLAKKPKKFMQKLQEIEYLVIAFNRRMLDLIDAVYVTPGPFALYRKSALIEIGLFDTKNMTQDIEIVWRLRSHGYNAKMCLPARVYSETPSKFKSWWNQRVRWNIGGTQTLFKYKSIVFRKGMLGAFIVPYFSLSLFMGLLGLGLYLYLTLRNIMLSYLSTKYSLAAETAILSLRELSFHPSILNFFGFFLFILGLTFTFLVLKVMKIHKVGNSKIFNVLFYMIIYLSIYPVIMARALYKMIIGKYTW